MKAPFVIVCFMHSDILELKMLCLVWGGLVGCLNLVLIDILREKELPKMQHLLLRFIIIVTWFDVFCILFPPILLILEYCGLISLSNFNRLFIFNKMDVITHSSNSGQKGWLSIVHFSNPGGRRGWWDTVIGTNVENPVPSSSNTVPSTSNNTGVSQNVPSTSNNTGVSQNAPSTSNNTNVSQKAQYSQAIDVNSEINTARHRIANMSAQERDNKLNEVFNKLYDMRNDKTNLSLNKGKTMNSADLTNIVFTTEDREFMRIHLEEKNLNNTYSFLYNKQGTFKGQYGYTGFIRQEILSKFDPNNPNNRN